MKFLLFSEISFEVAEPIALIEAYCFQSDFYSNFDFLENKKVPDVNKIGARIKSKLFPACLGVTDNTGNLRIFKYDLDRFLDLSKKTRDKHIKDLNKNVINKLMDIDGIGLSKATKIIHTLYPKLIPMIDGLLQDFYAELCLNNDTEKWTRKQSDQILVAYYDNLTKDKNRHNLDSLYADINGRIKGLTKLRIFDILWWSYLKAEKLSRKEDVVWSTIK